jgi:hypothetical protein
MHWLTQRRATYATLQRKCCRLGGTVIAVVLQLLHWQKRRDAAQPPGSPRLLRLVPAFKQPPLLLVPRQVGVAMP